MLENVRRRSCRFSVFHSLLKFCVRHLIIIFTRLSLKKKTYNVFLLSKLKVKMVSILCFRKWFQWYWRVFRVIKLVSNLYQGVFLQINFNFLCRIAKAIFLMSVVYKIASLFTQLNYCLERCNITVKEVFRPTIFSNLFFRSRYANKCKKAVNQCLI